MPREAPHNLLDRILDAAEAVVVRQGIANLTLDAVASDAKISKGGLLHHFPSKDKLIEGMVVRCAENWRECIVGSFESSRPGPGRMCRALLQHLSDADSWSEQCQRSSSAVFAALAQNPDLIQPMRAAYAELQKRLADDGLAPGVAETVAAAMDGLWLYRVLGLTRVDRRQMELVRVALETLVNKGEPEVRPRKTGAVKPSRRAGGRSVGASRGKRSGA